MENIRLDNVYLLRDDDEGMYNAYIFKEKIDIEKLEKFIYDFIQENQGTWNITEISFAIQKEYNSKIEKIYCFDYGNNTGNICKM